MHFDYANVLIFTGLGIGLCALMMGLGALLRPSNPERAKLYVTARLTDRANCRRTLRRVACEPSDCERYTG